MTVNPEHELIGLCIKGDRMAQKALYDRLASRMFPVCIRYVGERSVAEDILQEGFVTLFTRLDSFKGDGSFEGWARKIFVNTALMYLRKKDALKMSDELETARNLSTDITSQMDNIGYKELMKLITSLPTGFRTVFNILGPLVNPAGATGQVVGVFDAAYTEIMALCLRELGCRRAFVVHGSDGMDEITLCAPTRVSEILDGTIKTYELDPRSFGMEFCSLEELEGGGADENSCCNS